MLWFPPIDLEGASECCFSIYELKVELPLAEKVMISCGVDAPLWPGPLLRLEFEIADESRTPGWLLLLLM